MNGCTFCDEEFPTMLALAKHLFDKHDRVEVGASRLIKGSRYFWCWCDGAIYYTLDEFARHLELCGGLEKHFLECALRIKDQDPMPF